MVKDYMSLGEIINVRKNLNKTLMFLMIILLLFMSSVESINVKALSQVIQNDIFWKDVSGNPIYSQGGGIFKFGDTYYWYGVKYNGAVTYYNSPTKLNNDSSFNAVTCYSSKDLVNWKFENNILTSATLGMENSQWVGRLGVAYNKNTKKYVLITQFNDKELFASCNTPNGNFAVEGIQAKITNMVNDMTGDQTVFVDDDGKAYLICSSRNGRGNLYVAPLRESDYLNVEPATRVFGGVGREGNCMFKYNGRYYLCSSDLHGWNSSHCYYISAANIMGPYSSEAVMSGTDADFCHVTQTGFFVTVKGSAATTVIFCGDRWSDFAGNGLGYNQWCPLSFNNTTPVFNSLSQWNFDATTGEWSIGEGNNFVLNSSFEADRVSQNTLAGWTNWNSGTSDANSNTTGGHTGRFSMQQKSTSDYKSSMYQNIGLPNGTYTLKAWVKSSGGQNTCDLYIKDFGGSEMNYSIKNAINNWTQISISNINVTNGKCEVGIYSDAKANNWCQVDDISLVRTSSPSTMTPTKSPTPTPTKLIPTPTNYFNIDLNGDKTINMADVIILAQSFNMVRGDDKYNQAYDFNNDGAINMAEVIIMAGKFNTFV